MAQTEYSSFTVTGRGGATTFATDYQAIGINPANLGWSSKFEDKKVAFGLNEFTYSLHSAALSKQELRDQIRGLVDGTNTNFTQQQKIDAAKSFTDAGMAMNIDYGSIGAAITTDKLGGLAFRINDRFQFYSILGQGASEMLFLGKNAPYFDSLTVINGLDTSIIANDGTVPDTATILNGIANIPQLMSQILDGSRITASWYREYNISYGRKIIDIEEKFALYGGIGLKYLQGFALLDINGQSDEFEAYSSVTPFLNVDYGLAAASNPSSISQSGALPEAVGNGFGFDIGLNMLIKDKFKIGAALTNIGSINWTGNVYSIQDTLVYDTESEGINNYNVASSLGEFTGDNGLLRYKGEQERITKLPGSLRLGASMVLGEKAELGLDIIMPTNDEPGNIDKAIIGVGGDINPIPWVRLSAGFVTGGNYGTQIPVGISLFAPSGAYEFGIASRDAISFFTQNGPTLSLSLGFLRFRF